MSLYDPTFSRTIWRLYGGAKGLVMWYYSEDERAELRREWFLKLATKPAQQVHLATT
jgi:hypothetical protein